MKEQNIEKWLSGLANNTAEPPSPGLAEQIKQQIPEQLPVHKNKKDTINIIIDLRINKFAAAAVIILTLILFANFLRGRDSNGLYQDSKLVAKYLLVERNQSPNVAAGMRKYRTRVHQGKQAVFYGDVINPQDSDAVLMYWKLTNGKYGVMFADLREETVTAEQLIELQTRMLRDKAK